MCLWELNSFFFIFFSLIWVHHLLYGERNSLYIIGCWGTTKTRKFVFYELSPNQSNRVIVNIIVSHPLGSFRGVLQGQKRHFAEKSTSDSLLSFLLKVKSRIWTAPQTSAPNQTGLSTLFWLSCHLWYLLVGSTLLPTTYFLDVYFLYSQKILTVSEIMIMIRNLSFLRSECFRSIVLWKINKILKNSLINGVRFSRLSFFFFNYRRLE